MEEKKKQVRNTTGLRNLADRSPEERRAIQSKGGKATAAKRKEARLVREALLELLVKPVRSTKGKGNGVKTSYDIKSFDETLNGSANVTGMVSILAPIIKKAQEGDTYCVQLILAILGQLKPEGSSEATANSSVMIHLLRGEKPADSAENVLDESGIADA